MVIPLEKSTMSMVMEADIKRWTAERKAALVQANAVAPNLIDYEFKFLRHRNLCSIGHTLVLPDGSLDRGMKYARP